MTAGTVESAGEVAQRPSAQTSLAMPFAASVYPIPLWSLLLKRWHFQNVMEVLDFCAAPSHPHTLSISPWRFMGVVITSFLFVIKWYSVGFYFDRTNPLSSDVWPVSSCWLFRVSPQYMLSCRPLRAHKFPFLRAKRPRVQLLACPVIACSVF